METFDRLNDSDRGAVISLLSREPHINMLILSNIRNYGMEQGDTVFHGEYFGRRDESGLVAVGAVYGLGSLFVYGSSDEALEGIDDYLEGLELSPYCVVGKETQVERVLDEIGRRVDAGVRRYATDLLVVRGSVSTCDESRQARPATAGDLDQLVELAAGLEQELFEDSVLARAVMRDILTGHIENGTAFVIEVDGRIAAKAEATIVGETGAHIGGVYTVPGCRGLGYSTACVASLCRRLLDDVEMVVLSVQKDNDYAWKVYRRIGFEKVDDCMIAMLTFC